MARPSSRDRILDAYEDILIEHGPSAVTLESVAAKASVSKGGLLYHFGSKDALLNGLLERWSQLNEREIEHARRAPEGIVRYYLHSSATDVGADAALHRTTMAAVRLVLFDERVAEVSREVFERWRTVLREHTADPVLAELVATLGDGVYLRAAIGGNSEPALHDLDAALERIGL
ncbi:TetR/AcrR family transcriptional regulator [Haloechinothrix sp. LS1_15]|uniref:TetR/AcrR family transcriptional regulator n=1 Tax=Haloechinothrix sp. LS1_15 TaxID=2652248 RepID=UPI0029465E3C|nr:TetR/AcrR family transcriptional regulator [Haloechinothrix sp. LS1_15]MDV6011120.1 TetR/AcrR family transcriptional regulator [Haloechinothrix sp. LS1_15]